MEYGVRLLHALHDLVTFYVPALFHLGYKVRQCSWEGRPEGQVKGDTARSILEYSLLLQTHLQGDWSCRTPYVRTMALALCTWQPWMSKLPGCVFVEESGEAMLSRLSSACLHASHITDFTGTLNLYLTLQRQSQEPRITRGSIRRDLVDAVRGQITALVARPQDRLFPLVVNATQVRWVPDAPDTWQSPGVLPRRPHGDAITAVMKLAIATVVQGKFVMSQEMQLWLTSHVHLTAEDVLRSRADAVQTLGMPRRIPRAPAGYAHMRIDDASSSRTDLLNAAAGADTEVAAPVVKLEAEDTESLYEPPESLYEPPGSVDSEGYISPAASEGLGSLGELVYSSDDSQNGSASDVLYSSVCEKRTALGLGTSPVPVLCCFFV